MHKLTYVRCASRRSVYVNDVRPVAESPASQLTYRPDYLVNVFPAPYHIVLCEEYDICVA